MPLQIYPSIQQMRFQDRLKLAISADPETLDAAVTQMALQPIVENAISRIAACRSKTVIVDDEPLACEGLRMLLCDSRARRPALQASLCSLLHAQAPQQFRQAPRQCLRDVPHPLRVRKLGAIFALLRVMLPGAAKGALGFFAVLVLSFITTSALRRVPAIAPGDLGE